MRKDIIYATAYKKENGKVTGKQVGSREVELYEIGDKVTSEMIDFANRAKVVSEQNDMREAIEVKMGWKNATVGKSKVKPSDAVKI